MAEYGLLTTHSLVAIHGLNGHAFDTWTHKKSKVMWLKDLLPELVPNIRIMTYGYNARFLNFAAQQDLRSITKKLLTELVDLRQSEEVRVRISATASTLTGMTLGETSTPCLCLSQPRGNRG